MFQLNVEPSLGGVGHDDLWPCAACIAPLDCALCSSQQYYSTYACDSSSQPEAVYQQVQLQSQKQFRRYEFLKILFYFILQYFLNIRYWQNSSIFFLLCKLDVVRKTEPKA